MMTQSPPPRIASKRNHWSPKITRAFSTSSVITGKAHNEHETSAFPPKADTPQAPLAFSRPETDHPPRRHGGPDRRLLRHTAAPPPPAGAAAPSDRPWWKRGR